MFAAREADIVTVDLFLNSYADQTNRRSVADVMRGSFSMYEYVLYIYVRLYVYEHERTTRTQRPVFQEDYFSL